MALVSPLPKTTFEGMIAKLSELDNLPTLPTVLTRILKATGNANTGSKDLMTIVQNDPAIAARILKISNSAFYGMRCKIASVDRAITVIGFDEVRRIALTAMVAKAFPERAGVASFPLDRFWVHCVAAAYASKEILAGDESAGADEPFTAGLLHDIGKLIICQYYPKHFFLVVHYVQSLALESIAAENEILGVHHGQAGSLLSGIWELPPLYGKVMAHHHLDVLTLSESDPASRLVAAVALADTLARRANIGFSGSAKVPAYPDKAIEFLGIQESRLKSLERDFEERRSSFDLFV